MRVGVIGVGYVGLVQAACLASRRGGAHDVIAVDVDEAKIARLQRGECPIVEKNLPELLVQGRERITFTTQPRLLEPCDVVFVCVGTPSKPDGSVETAFVFRAAEAAAKNAPTATLVLKSTVPPGTNAEVAKEVRRWTSSMPVLSNPEFLRQGTAIEDWFRPERVVIGARKGDSVAQLSALQPPCPQAYVVAPESAELAKYAANAMLAVRVSLMNELAVICEDTNGDILDVAKIVGADSRIGPAYLSAGIGVGCSCLPKDVHALHALFEAMDEPAWTVEAVSRGNAAALRRLLFRIKDVNPRVVAIWGLACKPGTDDTRESRGVALREALEASNKIAVRSYDPTVLSTPTPLTAAAGADVIVLVTEWPELVTFDDFDSLRAAMLQGDRPSTRSLHIFDARNAWAGREAEITAAGFTYHGIGRCP